MTPPLYYSCHRLLSFSPFLSLLFGPISFLLSPAVSKSSTLFFSLSSSLSIFLNHLLPYCSLSTQIFHSTHPSTVSLASYPSLSHFTPSFSPSFSILALGTVMVHSATVFISASSPEWLCLYLNIRNTFFLKSYTKKKKEALLKMSKAVFILSAWALHLDKQHVHLPNNTPCECSRGKQGKNTLLC